MRTTAVAWPTLTRRFQVAARVPALTATGACLALMVAAYVVVFSAVTIHRYQTYSAFGDLATFEQIVWNSRHGSLFGTTYGQSIFPYWSMVLDHIALPISPESSYLEAHFEPGLLLTVPFYALWPHAETLLVLQSLALGLAAVPIYLIARKTLRYAIPSLLVAGAFLASPALTGINMVDFHGQAFLTLWIGAAVYALYAGRMRLYALFFVLALAMSEVACVTLAALGLYMLVFTTRRRAGVASLFVAVAYFLFVTKALIPFLSPTSDYPFTGYFSHWGGSPLTLARLLVTNPGDVLGFIFGIEQIRYVRALMLPVLFLPVLAPDILVIAGPVLLANLLADSPTQRLMYGHYSASILPLIYVAATVGASRLVAAVRSRLRPLHPHASVSLRSLTAFTFVAFTIVANSQISSWPIVNRLGWSSFVAPPNSATISRALALVPEGASVSTTDALATHLAGRRYLYLFPVHADDSDYLVLPKDDQTSRIWPLTLEQLTSYTTTLLRTGAFQVVLDEDGLMVLRRTTVVPLHLEAAAIEDEDRAVFYEGAWQRLVDAEATAGSVHVSDRADASATAHFDGPRILVVYRRCMECGIASVAIDGAFVGSIDAFGPPSEQRYRLFRVATGGHSVKLTLSSDRSPLSSGHRFYFDAFLEAAQ